MRILNKSFGSIVEPKPANLHLVVFINCKNADSAIILIKPYPYLATIMCNVGVCFVKFWQFLVLSEDNHSDCSQEYLWSLP